ncbi:TIGR04139 family peptide modification target [Pedobacter sp. UBA5917]|jgi:putative peptide modification target (TIGR04139 family)|uniref:TIGR04139 family peptide modification target n=1 Tax=Pedobacter sp. UBA5917 TaxID=1947061 RepID=UPI0025D8DC5F|nr:TIGR04139 family peptide modification target [Pedobacter sp. UBA5917]
MKNLKGMQKNFSALENKKLTDLRAISGGLAMVQNYSIQSNINVGEGCAEHDVYSGPGGTGKYLGRFITGA